MQNPFFRPIENHHLHWFNMTQSYKHTIPQCIWKPCRHHSYRRPMCTRGILVIFGGHLGFDIKMTPLPNKQKQKHYLNTKNGFVALKLVGLEVLLWSLYHIGQSLGFPQIQNVVGHFGFSIKMTPKRNFNTRNGFVALQLVGSEVLL